MSARYVDPSSTSVVEVQGVKFTIGFWPPSKADRVNLALAKVRRLGAVDFLTADPEVACSAIGLNRDVLEEAVRHSVRGWEWEGAPPAVVVDGVLSSDCVDAIRLSGLILELSTKCMAFNTLDEEEKKSSAGQ